MNRLPRLAIPLLIAALLSACASDGTLASLKESRALCATGNQVSCNSVPEYEHQAEIERSNSAGKIAVGVLLVPVIALAAVVVAADQQHPHYSPYRSTTTCSSYFNSTTCSSY